MSWFKRLILLFFLAALVLAGIKLVQLRKQQLRAVTSPQRPVMMVHTKRVIDDSLEITQTYRGVVRPERTVALTPRIQGQIEHMQGEAGDEIQAGQVLVRLDDQEIQQEIAALGAEKEGIESRIWILEKNYTRQEQLVNQGNISQEVFDQTTSDLRQARADLKNIGHQLAQARARQSYTRLHADIDGRVQKRMQEPGDMAQPGKQVMLLEDASTGYNVHVRIPAAVQNEVQSGQKVVFGYKGQKQKAAITRIHPATPRDSALVEIEAFVQEPPFGLASGASLQTELVIARVSEMIVPSRAVFSQEQESFVFVVDEDHRIQPRPVQVMARTADKAAVQGDLSPGEQVAVGPLSQLMRLSPDMKVDVAGEPSP
ncbi:MAG: efflux RND transporter periplasmic adaptor subunit [Thermodesulfobacteriota bacterium]